MAVKNRVKKGLKIFGIVLLVFVVGWYGIVNFVFGVKVKRAIQEIKDAGEPLQTIDFAPPQVPDEENADIFLFDLSKSTPPVKFVSILWSDKEKDVIRKIFKQTSSTSPVIIESKDFQLIRNVVKRNSQVLEIMHKACLRKYLRFNTDYSKGMETKVPRCADSITRIRLLMCRALLNCYDGRIDQSFEDIMTGLRVNNLFLQPPWLISTMISIAQSNILTRTLRTIVHKNQLGNQQYDRLILELNSYKQAANTSFKKVMLAERAVLMEFFNGLLHIPPKLDHALSRWVFTKSYLILLRPLVKMDYLYYIRWWKQFIKLLDEPYYQARAEYEELQTIPARYIFSRVITPRVSNLHERIAMSNSNTDLCVISICLEKYKNKYKKYPVTLQDLVPEFITELPVNPATGKRYQYKQRRKSYVLWVE